jgi:hypothetical protein
MSPLLNRFQETRVPSLADLSFLSGAGVLVGLVLTAACIALIADWRLALFALAFEYVLLGLLLTSLVQPAVATVRIIAGGMAASILYVTMWQRADKLRREMHPPGSSVVIPPEAPPQVFIVGFPFRLFAVALVAVAIIGFASSMTFLSLPGFVLFSSLWLMAIGLLISMLSHDALRLGLGILVFTGGFGVLDTAIESSFFLYGLLNVADLVIAVVVAHLATLPGDGGLSRRHGDQP